MMAENLKLTVRTFVMGTDKEAALKPLEEAAEIYSAWQEHNENIPKGMCLSDWGYPTCDRCPIKCYTYENPRILDVGREDLADEIADCIQACCNLAARYDIDLQAAMERCELSNRKRGRCQ